MPNQFLGVTNERTQVAARRLVQEEGVEDLVVLNFASAKRPGGGFYKGARAQEEDLARASGLIRCLESQPDYYFKNQASGSSLYTDHMIYSPGVPWFRAEDNRLLERPFRASVITAPAPNAREHLKRFPGDKARLRETLDRRAGFVLALAAAQGHGTCLLGAWGCGVFGNDPEVVAKAFVNHLKGRRFRNRFERIVFAVFDPSNENKNFRAFKKYAGP